MQQRTRLTHSGFTSTEYRTKRGRARHKKRRAPSADSMLIKFGACALVCALALLMNVRRQRQIVAVSAQEDPREYGRLTFVELPGILEVFAPSELAAFQLDYSGEAYDEASLSLSLTSACRQPVPAALAGRVKSAGDGSVSLMLDGDRELCFSGLNDVSVEEGQTLGVLDTVGTVEADAVLTISAREGGRPVDPRTLLRLADGAAV